MVSSRGQSEVLGFVLLVGITVAAIAGILLIGSPMLDAVQGEIGTEKATHVAGQFHRSASLVADGGAEARRLDSAGTPVSVDSHRGWLRVRAGDSTLVNETLGTVRFTHGSPAVVYQGGAVIYADDGQAVLREGPRIDYRAGTLDLTLVGVRGTTSSARAVRLTNGPSAQVYPDPAAGLTNPVDSGAFTVTVQSEYYRVWGAFLAEQTGATPTYNDANRTTSVTLVPEYATGPVDTGVVSGTPTGTLELTGGVSVDSYNSSEGPYTGGGSSGRVSAAGDVVLKGGGELHGGLRTNGDVTVEGGSELTGPVDAGGDFTLTGGGETAGDVRVAGNATVDYGTAFSGTLTHGGTLTDPGNAVGSATQAPVSVTVPQPAPIAAHFNRTVEFVRTENDNGTVAAISGGGIDCTQFADDECRLGPGRYFLDDISLGSSETLVFDTTDGNVTVVVDGDVNLDGAATVRTVGDGRVNVYVTGDYRQRGGATVTNADDRASRFWLYLRPGSTADLEGGGRFVGVIYGPGGAGTGAHIEPSIPIFGALVGDIDFVGGGTDIHYDAALTRIEPVQAPTGTAPVSFLHARYVQVNVTNAA